MNKLLPNLLIFFAIALCALCAVQWVREARLRKKIDGLDQMVYERDQTIQGLQGSLKRAEAEIVRLDTRNNELKATEKTNTLEIAGLKRSLRKAENENGREKDSQNVLHVQPPLLSMEVIFTAHYSVRQ